METPSTRVSRKVRQVVMAMEASVDVDGIAVTDVVGLAVWYAQKSKHYTNKYFVTHRCTRQCMVAMHTCG